MTVEKQRILLLDIETSPNLAWVWGMYEQNVVKIEKPRTLMAFSYKWLGKNTINTYSQKDLTERKLLKKLWECLDEADIVVGHNIDRFDIKMANSFMVHLGLKSPSPYKTVDTYKIAKRKFRFNSNALSDLAEYLKCGKKLKTGGIELWLGCLKDEEKCWNKMIRYNKRDVSILERVYLILRGWDNHPRVNFFDGRKCPLCSSGAIEGRGWRRSGNVKTQRFYCRDCGSWSRGESLKFKFEIK